MRLPGIFRKSVKPGRLGIEVGPYGLGMAWVNRSGDGPGGVCDCHYVEGNDLAKNRIGLETYLSENAFAGMPTNVVLHPAMYDIFFVDRPEVEDHELAEAVRFKIKDLVDLPLKELIVDAFAVPDDAYRGNQKKVYAVCARKSFLEEVVLTVKEAGLDLRTIGIGELAVRNIVGLLHQDRGSAAMLRMRNSNGTIYLSDGGDLYLTRHVESGISKLEKDGDAGGHAVMDELLLEIQRSLDFYYSQLGKGAIRNFLIAPTRLDHDAMDEYLCDNLGLKVRSLNVNEMFDSEREISGELQGNCFAALGAACDEVQH